MFFKRIKFHDVLDMQIKKFNMKRNKSKKSFFDLSHTKAMTVGFDGKLYPILCEPVLPGDVWKGRSDILGRVTL